jgi:hypothetical protein
MVNSRPMCTFCGRQGQDANRCFTNPANPNNRLGNSSLQPSAQRSGPNCRSAMVHSVDPKAPVFTPPGVPEDIPAPQAAALAAEQPAQREARGRGPRAYRLLIARAPPEILPDSSSSVASPILIDSGASTHMCPHREWFTAIRPCTPSHILLGDDSTLVCKEEGTIHLRFTQVHVRTHFCSLIPSTLPRFVTRSFLAVPSLPQPCIPILRAPRAPSTTSSPHHRRYWSLVVANAMDSTS